MTTHVSADTDDLDRFVEHGREVQGPLRSTWETLARQRSFLLGIGLHATVQPSDIAVLDETVGFMADLDRFVDDISTALKRHGLHRGDGRRRAPTSTVDRGLDRTDDQQLDALQAALEAEGLDPMDAERIRAEVDEILGYDPRFQIDGATASEPRALAVAIVADIDRRAATLIEDNHTASPALHAQPRPSTDRLAADLHYGRNTGEFVPMGALEEALRRRLGDDEHRNVQDELVALEDRQRRANLSLIAGADGEVVLDGDTVELNGAARQLYDDNRSGGGIDGPPRRLDEPEIAYQLQKIAEADPGRALGIKLMLDLFLDHDEQAELDRILASGGSFGERLDLAVSHPVEGLTGAVKGAYNENVGWWADRWADATVTIANGFHGLAVGSTGSTGSTGRPYAHRVPRTWDENAAIVQLELELDNLAERGGADAALAVELASAAYGGGKAGLSLVRVGRRYFVRSGSDLVASVGPELAARLDEGAEAIPMVVRSTDEAGRTAEVVDDVIAIAPSDYQRVLALGRPGHAIDGNINGWGLASGGHYVRSPNLRLTAVHDVDANGVIRAESQIRGRNGRWITKLDDRGDSAVSSFFPEWWSRRQTVIEIDTAFKNSAAQPIHAVSVDGKPPPAPTHWLGRTSDGIRVRGRYAVSGDPSHGWSSAYPVAGRR